jgi:PAT family beta-lactamase induction signal transducer AmpG
MMFAMSTPLLAHLSMDTSARGVLGGFATATSVVGSMLGAALIARRSLRATLFPIAAVQSAAILLYVTLAVVRPGVPGIAAVVLLEQLVAGIGTAAFVVFLTRICVAEYRASHFAIATSLMQVAAMGAGAASGYLAEWLGFPGVFALAFAASLPGVVLARSVPTE